MEMIRYKMDRIGRDCFTDCPHQDRNNCRRDECEDRSIKVGSVYCLYKCPYFVKEFEHEQIVHCGYVNDKGVELNER